MAQLKFGSAGVSFKEIDISGPITQSPTGVPAGIIGTSQKGPAFVPVTVGSLQDFYNKFGKTDGKKFGPLAVSEWLRNAGSVTYLRVLGVGDGKKRNSDGTVTNAGFVVGENLPYLSSGALAGNPYAITNGSPGRLYFLGAFMSESAGSTVFSDAGLQSSARSVPVIRGVIMAPSGVLLQLSATAISNVTSYVPAIETNFLGGYAYGAVNYNNISSPRQEFTMLLHGLKIDPVYSRVITASFDMTAPNYFAKVFNTDPYKYQQAGHYLYANWDIHPSMAIVTASGIVTTTRGAWGSNPEIRGKEAASFITTGSLARNLGNNFVPNYENWNDRFSYAKSPWIISQKFGGVSTNLFRVHALDAGSDISTKYKFSIENIVLSKDPNDNYCNFDFIVRDWNDYDTNIKILESFRGVNLNPNSNRYICKVIGDATIFYEFDRNESQQRLIVEGSYENKSNLIRVEVSEQVRNQLIDPTTIPMGYRGYAHLVTSGSGPIADPNGTFLYAEFPNTPYSFGVLKRITQPPVPIRKTITQGAGSRISANSLLYWGTMFEHATSVSDQNISTIKNESLNGYAKYFPDYSTTFANVVAGDNAGVADTPENGIMDSDRFCYNYFSLENLQVVTASNKLADPNAWKNATYVRSGDINSVESKKTRRLVIDDFITENTKYLKFSFFMQGGFDGLNLFDKDEYEISNNAVNYDMAHVNRGLQNSPSVKSYLKAIEIMKNVTNVDIQLLAIPGIRHSIISNAAIEAVEDRFDAMYVMDVEQYDSEGKLVTKDNQIPSVYNTLDAFRNRALDTNFAAAYFPDVVIQDPNTKTNLFVPPSVVVLGALALNDAIGYPWFAPAGFTRGALGSTLETRVQLSKGNMDSLHNVSINPIVSFPNSTISGTGPKGGAVVWGQKTLQVAASALDRVNVRRLLIDIRRQVKQIANTIVFEPNREATLAKFSDAITPNLLRIQERAGLERYKVIIDSSTTTQADIENNTLRGKILIQPTKSIEFVSLDFVVANNLS